MRKIKLEEMPQITPQSFGRRRGYDSATQKPVELVSQKRHYKLITPLFGGGREAGVPDETQPVSGKSDSWTSAVFGGARCAAVNSAASWRRCARPNGAFGAVPPKVINAFPPLVGISGSEP